jgi:hypothetical protein
LPCSCTNELARMHKQRKLDVLLAEEEMNRIANW